ncbi:DUF502 domain-containing protein [Thiocapsa bogorovii]|uniref:DUF502 domain-containing protein n=1 Tax=Thiocapsa roseopersicina TaxID=1058 RepID=A0A1Z2RRF1_THIRO|nr:DUF502 domain-containing protein [Thiocapsa bogorovii]ASA46422.1 hypothetical protein [Thiocapsa roseopersicina]UHD16608.1 DUF502 domain-containing protein [Thiocapsa bogorovii]
MTHIRRNLLTGVVTVIPLMVTSFVFIFFLDLLSGIGRPKVIILANAVRPLSPEFARWISEVPWLSSALAISLTLLMLYLLGWAVTHLIGRRILSGLEGWLRRIPFVTTIYGATKRLVEAFRSDGIETPRRVVLIEFPHSEMKAVGFHTHTMIDRESGIELAAVYVPTAPNPTGGYLEIVPVDRIIPQDWTVDEAMTFVVSGGTTAPETIRFTRPGASRGGHPRTATSAAVTPEGLMCPLGARSANR